VLLPTRELAVQVTGELLRFGKSSGLRIVPVYGGQPIDRQFRALRDGAQVVVGTPGRVLDHLRRGTLDLGRVTFATLDEADEMLAFGFIEDIEAILAELPPERQLALFSATMPPRIAALVRKFLPNAETVAIRARRRTLRRPTRPITRCRRAKSRTRSPACWTWKRPARPSCFAAPGRKRTIWPTICARAATAPRRSMAT
jgi:superfamily II DNA/RNA helicase